MKPSSVLNEKQTPQLTPAHKTRSMVRFLTSFSCQVPTTHFFKTAPRVSALLSVTRTVKHQFFPVFFLFRTCIFVQSAIPCLASKAFVFKGV